MKIEYEILRVNPLEKTVTVLLNIDDRTLQEDVVVENFTNLEHIDQKIQARLEKFMEDLAVSLESKDVKVHPDLQGFINKHTK